MRILIIEDEKVIAQTIKAGLEEELYAVDIAYDGEDGLEQALCQEYDVIILDWMLPKLDGIALCQKLRDEKIKTPILMLTAKDTIEDRVKGLNTGADDYVVKPFSFSELLARISSLIRRKYDSQPLLSVDSLQLDPISHMVYRKERLIELTGKEFALLEYFLRHPHQILSKDQIFNHVWDDTNDTLSNVIEVLVKRLRDKIDKAFPQEKALFSTVRGLGYRLG